MYATDLVYRTLQFTQLRAIKSFCKYCVESRLQVCTACFQHLTSLRPSAPLFALIKFKLGAHTLRVETQLGGWSQRLLGSSMSVGIAQQWLLDCSFYSIIRGNTFLRLVRITNSFLEQNSHQLVAHHTHLCFQARMCDESHLAAQLRLQYSCKA